MKSTRKTLRGESHPRFKTKQSTSISDTRFIRKRFSSNIIARNFKISPWNVEEIVKEKLGNICKFKIFFVSLYNLNKFYGRSKTN